MAEKTIRVAVWEYLNAEGKRRLAYFGDDVDLSESEIERGEDAGVFLDPDDSVEESEEEPAGGDPDDAKTPEVERPANTATTAEWVEYAVSQGLDRSEMEKLKRAEIIAAVQ